MFPHSIILNNAIYDTVSPLNVITANILKFC